MKMTIIPAIDVIGGKCVRLTRGDYGCCTTYGESPVEMARRFEDAGMERLHLVDLDGAKASRVMNLRVLEQICGVTRLKVDFSGGIKSDRDIHQVFEAGATFFCVGSMAQREPERTWEWLERYGNDRVIIGADVRGEQVCINGWQVKTDTTVYELIERYLPRLKYLMCTDIAKDGMLGGPSVTLYQNLLARYPGLALIASGGVSCSADIQALAAVGVTSVVVGKALYEGIGGVSS